MHTDNNDQPFFDRAKPVILYSQEHGARKPRMGTDTPLFLQAAQARPDQGQTRAIERFPEPEDGALPGKWGSFVGGRFPMVCTRHSVLRRTSRTHTWHYLRSEYDFLRRDR